MLRRPRARMTSADQLYREPVDVAGTLAGDALAGLLGSPVARLAETTAGNRAQKGSQLAPPQRFVMPSGGPNTDEALEVAPISVNHAARLNKRRGTLDMGLS